MLTDASWTDDFGLGYFLSHFAHSRSTVAACLGLGLLAVVIAASVPRRRGIVLATGLSLAAVGGLTLAPAGGWRTFTITPDPVAAVRWALRPHWADLWAWSAADGPANVLLFIPLGLCLALLLRRPVIALVLNGLISIAVESYQAATGTRDGTFADVVTNSMGALIGVTVGALTLAVRRRPSAATSGTSRSPQQLRR